jgi:hypothetical protein
MEGDHAAFALYFRFQDDGMNLRIARLHFAFSAQAYRITEGLKQMKNLRSRFNLLFSSYSLGRVKLLPRTILYVWIS